MRSAFTPILLLAAALSGQEKPVPDGGAVMGRVISALTGKPVSGAAVELPGTERRAFTDSAGRFRLEGLPPGSYDLAVRHPEYQVASIHNVILLGRQAEEREVELWPQAMDLADATVKAAPTQKIYDMPNSTHVLDGEEIRRTPGALMDVQRVVQKLPGVAARGDNVNEVIARGGFPGENLFLLDNIEVPNPNYFGNQGTGGGVISVINPLLVKKLAFNSGAPPARYGGKASSVLDVQLREGNPDFLFGGADLGFAGAGLHADGPLWRDASFMGSFRKSYLDLLAEFEPSTAIPEFWGGQAKATQKAGSGKTQANGLFGRSSIRIENAEEAFGTDGDVIEAGGDVFAAGITGHRYLGDRWEVLATASGTGNEVRRRQYFRGSEDGGTNRRTQEYAHALKAEANYFAGNKSKWSVGAEAKRLEFRDHLDAAPDTLKRYASSADPGLPVLDARGRPVTGFRAPPSALDTWQGALFASVNFPVARTLSLALGLRGEAFALAEDFSLQPRLALRWALNDRMEITASAGTQSQIQDFLDYAARPSNQDMASKRSGVASVEWNWFLREFSTQAGLNLYVKGYRNLALDSLYSGDSLFQFQSSPARLEDGEAFSRGLEIFLERKPARNWFWSAAYSLSRSETRFPEANGGRWYPSDFDFPQVANITGGRIFELLDQDWYRGIRRRAWFQALCWLIPLGDRMEASFRFRHAGGRPVTPLAYAPEFRRWELDLDAVNSGRLPDYYSLDLRLERRLGYGWLRMMFYLDFQNVLNRENVFAYMHNDATGRRVTVTQLPFFPVGGFIIGF